MQASQLASPSFRSDYRHRTSSARDGRPILVAAVVGAVALAAVAVVTAPLGRDDRPSSETTQRQVVSWTYASHHTNP